MDYCSHPVSSDWKTDPGGEMSQQNYLAYLKLRRSDEPMDLIMNEPTEIIRRTRRVVYRYILDKSPEETNRNEEKGNIALVDKSKDIPRKSLKRKKLLQNISLEPNVKTENNSDIPRVKRSRKRLPECSQTVPTLQSKKERRKDEFCDDLLVLTSDKSKKSFLEIKGSRGKKQTRKRPMNDALNGSGREAYKKRKKIVSDYSIKKDIKAELELYDSPAKAKMEKKAGQIGFKDNTYSFRNVELTKKDRAVDYNTRSVLKQEETMFVETGVQFNNLSTGQINSTLSLEEQLQEIFLHRIPEEYITGMGNFASVPYIENEVEIETSLTIENEPIATDTEAINNSLNSINDDSQRTSDTLEASNHVNYPLNGKHPIEDDNFIVLGNCLEANNTEEHVVIGTIEKDEVGDKIFILSPNVELDNNVLSNLEVGGQIEVDDSRELIETRKTSLNCSNLEINSFKDKIIHIVPRKTEPLECNNDKKKKQLMRETRRSFKCSSNSHNDVQTVVKDASGTEQNNLHPNNVELVIEGDPVPNDDDQLVTECSRKQPSKNYEHTKRKDTLIIRQNTTDKNNDKWQNVGDAEEINISSEHQLRQNDFRITKQSVKSEDSGPSVEEDTEFNSDKMPIATDIIPLESNNDKCIRENDLRTQYLLEPDKMIKDTSRIVTNTPEPDCDKTSITQDNNDVQQINKKAVKFNVTLEELKDSREPSNNDMNIEMKNLQPSVEIEEKEKIVKTEELLKLTTDTSRELEHSVETISRAEHIKIDTKETDGDLHNISMQTLQAYDDEQQVEGNKVKITERSEDLKVEEQQLTIHTLGIRKHSLERNIDLCQTPKEIPELSEQAPEQDDDEQHKSKDVLLVIEDTLDSNNDECRKLSEHSLDVYVDGQRNETDCMNIGISSLDKLEVSVDNQQRMKDISRSSEYSSENRQVQQEEIVEYSPVANTYEIKTIKESPESSLKIDNDEYQIQEYILNIAESSAQIDNDDQPINEDNMKIMSYSLNLKCEQKHITKDTLDVTEICSEPNIDVCQTTEETLKISELPLEADDEQQINEDILLTTEHTLAPNNDVCQKSSEHSLDVYADKQGEKDIAFTLENDNYCLDSVNDNQQRMEDIYQSPEPPLENRRVDQNEIKEYSPVSNSDELQIMKEAPKICELPLCTDNDEHKTKENIIKIREPSAELDNDDQPIFKDCMRIRTYPGKSKRKQTHITKDNLDVTKISAVNNTDVCQITEDTPSKEAHDCEQHIIKNFLLITERNLEPNNAICKKLSEHSLDTHVEDSLSINVPTLDNNTYCMEFSFDNHQRIKDIFQSPEHSSENRWDHQKGLEEEIQITKESPEIPKSSLRTDKNDEHQKKENIPKITEPSAEFDNADQRINKDSKIIKTYPGKSKRKQKHKTKDNLGITKISPVHNIDVCQTTEHTLKISEPSLEADGGEQHTIKNILLITEDTLEHNNEVCKELSEQSFDPYFDDQQSEEDCLCINAHTLDNDEYCLELSNDNRQRMKHIYRSSELSCNNRQKKQYRMEAYSPVANADEIQTTKEYWITPKPSLRTDNDQRQITRNIFKIAEPSPEPTGINQKKTEQMLKLSESSLEADGNEQQEGKSILLIRESSPEANNDECTKLFENSLEVCDIVTCLEPNVDEYQSTKETVKTSKYPLEVDYNVHQIRQNIGLIIKHNQEPNNDVCHKLSQNSLEICNDEKQSDKDSSLENDEHHLEPTNDDHSVIKYTFRSSSTSLKTRKDEQQGIIERYLEVDNGGKQETENIIKIKESSAKSYIEEQPLKKNNVRIRRYSVNSKREAKTITKDSSLEANTEVHKIAKEQQLVKKNIVIISEHTLRPKNDVWQKLPKRSPEVYDDEKKTENDCISMNAESSLDNDVFTLGKDGKNDQQGITEHNPGIDNDQQQITENNLKIKEPPAQCNNDEQSIENDTMRLTTHSEMSKHKSKEIMEDNYIKTEISLAPSNYQCRIAKESLKISENSPELDHQRAIDNLNIIQNSQEHKYVWQITEDRPKASTCSVGTDYNGQCVIKNILRLTDYPIEENDEHHIRKKVKISNNSPETATAELSSDDGERKITESRTQKQAKCILENYPNNDDHQEADNEMLAEFEVSLERSINDEHIVAINTMRKEKDIYELKINTPQENKEHTSPITEDCLELGRYEEQVTSYADQLQNISSPLKNDEVEENVFSELHLEVEVEINDGTEYILTSENSPMLNDNEVEISKDTSEVTENSVSNLDDSLPESTSEKGHQTNSCPRTRRTNRARNIEEKDLLPNRQYKEVESGEPSRIEIVHYKPNKSNTRKYCTYCNVGITNEIVLEKHISQCKLNPENVRVKPLETFYCKYCNFGITDEVLFRQHVEKCQNEVISKPVNTSSNPVTQQADSKVKRKRPTIGKHKCPNCDYTSDNISHMGMHKRTHDKIPLCTCDVCKKGFTRLDVLRIHMFRHLDVAKEIIEIKKIDVWNGNATKSTLEVNIKDKDFTIVKYQCSKCQYATPIALSMERHYDSIHLNITNFKCNLCSFATNEKSNLSKHLNWHSREKTYKCSYCSYETINKSYIKHHENQVHLKAISFKCDSCDFVAYRKENLKSHINSMHLKLKKYQCQQCDYFSYVQSNLIGHVKYMHKGIKRKYKRK